MQTLDHDSASIEIEAPAQVVFNLITNIDQMARCSPELMSLAGRRRPGSPWCSLRSRQPGVRLQTNLSSPSTNHTKGSRSAARTLRRTLVWAYGLDSDGNKTVLTRVLSSHQAREPHRLDDHRERLR